jgi:hypothetical protein
MTFRSLNQQISGVGGGALVAAVIATTGIACSGVSSGERVGRQGADLAQEQGLDYSWGRPSSPEALRAAGYAFVARYLSYDTTGKNLTAGEAQGLFAAGIDVVANWEAGAEDALQGQSEGVSEAEEAQTLAAGCGMPPDRPIYFSVDFDATPDQLAAIESYFDGVASVLGPGRVGAYGSYYVIQSLFDDGKIQWGWQTTAWSGGQWDPRAQLQQIENCISVAGVSADLDQSTVSDFGQWGPGAPTTTPPPPPPPQEGSQAFLYPNQQHYFDTDGSGNIRHHWYDGSTQSITTANWGSAAVGANPVTFVDGTSQHIFARDGSGALQHWYWDPVNGLGQDTWASSGLAGDPAAIMIGDFQDVWAVDSGNNLQHWYWGPDTGRQQDAPWASGVVGRPSALLYENGEQHVFVRGTPGNTLEHYWWSPVDGLIHSGAWGSSVVAGDPASLAVGDFQDVWVVDATGTLQQWYWGPDTDGVQQASWGAGGPQVVGRPSVSLYGNGEQHAFVRGTSGTLEHWWWTASSGLLHDTWNTASSGIVIVGDPTAEVINSQQHVWALDAAFHAQHWYWDPTTNVIHQDDWGP